MEAATKAPPARCSFALRRKHRSPIRAPIGSKAVVPHDLLERDLLVLVSSHEGLGDGFLVEEVNVGFVGVTAHDGSQVLPAFTDERTLGRSPAVAALAARAAGTTQPARVTGRRCGRPRLAV